MKSPTVTTDNKKKDPQTRPAAAGPTEVSMSLKIVNSCVVVLTALAEKCCQKAVMTVKTVATKLNASAVCEIDRLGKGLTSMSEPVTASSSECQPGKVARTPNAINSRIAATILPMEVSYVLELEWGSLH